MSVYLPKYRDAKGELRTSKVYWLEFRFQGQEIRESTGTRSITLARRIQDKRRRELEEGAGGVRQPARPRLFKIAAADYLETKRATLAHSSWMIEKANLKHLIPQFGRRLVCDIEPTDISGYQQRRTVEGAAPRTINLEIGTMRAILKRHGVWSRIQPDVRMLQVQDDVGRAITAKEEQALLQACAESRSRLLLPFVTVAIETGARYGVIRTLRWGDIDFANRCLKFGKDKTSYGSGRIVPLSDPAVSALRTWAAQFPIRRAAHYVFPSVRYGGTGKKHRFGFEGSIPYETDPAQPIGDIKEAWERAKVRAGEFLQRGEGDELTVTTLRCRFHDLRHTAVSRMLDAGVPLTKVATIVGWSPSTMVQMAARYGHFTLDELRGAVDVINKRHLAPVSSVLQSSCAKAPNRSFVPLVETFEKPIRTSEECIANS